MSDARPIELPNITCASEVIARDDEFLISGGVAEDDRVRYVRMRGSDGAILPDINGQIPALRGFEVTTSGASRMAATARSWLFVERQSSGVYEVSLYDAAFHRIGTPWSLSTDSDAFDDVIAGDGQYLLIWSSGKAVRIRESDGALLDATPIQFSRYDYTTGARGVYANGIYQLVWQRYSSLWGSRIRASDGALLDPDDLVNELSGAKRICLNCADRSEFDLDRAADGTVVVAWSTLTGRYAAPIDVTLGTRPAGETSLPSTAWSSKNTAFEMHWLPTGGVLYETRDGLAQLQGVSIEPSPFELVLGEQVPIWSSAAPRSNPATAHVPGSYLVAYSADNIIYASLLDDSTGMYLRAPLQLGSGSAPAVSSDGRGFLVAWITGSTLHRARVTTLGTVTNLDETAIDSSSWIDPKSIRLQCGSASCLLTFIGSGAGQTLALKLALDGTFLDGTAIQLTSSLMLSDWRYRMVVGPASAPDNETYLMFGGTHGDQLRRLLEPSGTVVDPPIDYAEDVSGLAEPAVASDGSKVAVFYRDYEGLGQSSLYALLVDPVTGSAVPGSGSLVFSVPDTVAATAAWYDGRSFDAVVAARPPGAPTAFYLQRFDQALGRLDGAEAEWGTPITSTSYATSAFAATSDGSGRSLVVYQENDVSHFGVTLKARFIDNDGLSSAGKAGNGVAGEASVPVSGGGASAIPSGSGGTTFSASGYAGQPGIGGTVSSSGGTTAASSAEGGNGTLGIGGALISNGGTTAALSAVAGTGAIGIGGALISSGGTTAASNAVGGNGTLGMGGATSPLVSGGGQAAMSTGGALTAGATSAGHSTSPAGGTVGVLGQGGTNNVVQTTGGANTSGTALSIGSVEAALGGAVASATSDLGPVGGSGLVVQGSGCECRTSSGRRQTRATPWYWVVLGLGLARVRRRRPPFARRTDQNKLKNRCYAS